MLTRYYAAFIPSDAGYAIFVPDFPEVASQGVDVRECVAMADDALSLAVKAYIKAKKPMPLPSGIDEARRKVAHELAFLGVALPEGVIWQGIQPREARERLALARQAQVGTSPTWGGEQCAAIGA